MAMLAPYSTKSFGLFKLRKIVKIVLERMLSGSPYKEYQSNQYFLNWDHSNQSSNNTGLSVY